MKSLKSHILFTLLLISSLVTAQKSKDLKELEKLKGEIRQSTYYDSAAVFIKGKKAIAIAKKHHLLSEESLIYQYYGNFYFFSYNIDKANKSYSKSMEIARKAGNGQLINSTKVRLAFIESTTNIFSAEKMFKTHLTEAVKKGYLDNQVEIYNGLGNIYSDRMIQDSAMAYYLKGLKVAEKTKNKYHQSMVLNNIGLLKFNNKQTQSAAKDFERALNLLKDENEDRLKLNLNNNLGLVFKELNNYKAAVKYYHNTLDYAKRLGFPLGISVAYLNLSDSYQNTKDYKKALSYADSAITRLRTLNEFDYLGMAFSIKAVILNTQGQTDLSKKYLDSVVHFKSYYNSPNNIMRYHDVMSSVFEKEGNYKLALYHNDRYHTIKDSLDNATNQDKLSQLQVIYGKERVEADLENEKNKNNLLSKENELRQARLNSIIIISILLLVAAIGAMFLRSVYLSKKQQAAFTQKLIENTDNERSRISRDLHDDIGQSLSVIKSKVNMFNAGKISSIEGLEKDVGDVIEQTRVISHALHPSAVAKLGIERSVVSLLEKTQNSTGIISSISIKNDIESIPVEIKTQLYRIIQECISNTIKHANATALKVSIKIVNNLLTVTYQDNGTGIQNEKEIHQGIGMLTIIERAKSINGKVTINNSNKGFKLTLEVQLTL